MSDYHLRAAADALDRHWNDDVTVAASALLRTVADSARQQGTDAVWWPLVESGIWTDALALADAILGVTDGSAR